MPIVLNLLLLLIFFSQVGILNATLIKVENSEHNLQHIINKSNIGDTIIISGVSYNTDSIVINKPLTLLGKDNATITGLDRAHILIVKSESVTISGFTIRNSGNSYVEDRSGIKLDSAHNCLIENNQILNCMFAIHATSSDSITIRNNRIKSFGTSESFTGNAIHLWYCKNIIIHDNNLQKHRDGIYFEFVTNIKVYNNYSANHLRYGLHFMFSHTAEYHDNIFEKNGSGVAVMYTEHVKMFRNIFRNNWGSASYGILIKDIKNSEIIDNHFLQNTAGIFLDGGLRINIKGNKFERNAWALRVMASSLDNVITRNNFLSNTFDISTNSSISNNKYHENYWDKYSGYDLNRDGVGDVAYYPVRLFSFLVERNPALLILLNSFFVHILDLAENLIPSITPDSLFDEQPLMNPII